MEYKVKAAEIDPESAYDDYEFTILSDMKRAANLCFSYTVRHRIKALADHRFLRGISREETYDEFHYNYWKYEIKRKFK